jgi:hypothetical protein
MPVIVPFPSTPTPPPTATVTAPAVRAIFTFGATTVTIPTLEAVTTSLGLANSRTDAAGAGSATLTFRDDTRILDPDNTSSSLYGHLTPGGPTTVQVQAWNGTVWVPLITGGIQQIDTTYPGATLNEVTVQIVDAARDLIQHIPPASTVYPMQQSGTRIAQMVTSPARSSWGWTTRALSGSSAIDFGQKVLKPITTDGTTSTWQYITDAAAAEKGVIFFDQAGVLTYQDQLHRYRSSSPRYTFGDAPATEVWVDQNLTYSLPNDRVIADVAYNTGDGITSGYGPGGVFFWPTTTSTQTTAQVSATDTQLADQMQGLSRARWEYNHYSVNRRDASTVSINAYGEWPSITGTARFGCAINAQLGDYVKLNRRPAVGAIISKFYWIDQIQHAISGGSNPSWVTTFTLAAADEIPAVWQLGTTKLTDVTAPLPW